MNNEESNYIWQFRHVASLPSQSSARSFSRGIFTNGDIQLTEAPVGDRLVHFYENCTRWREQVEEMGMLDQELNLFRQGVTFQNTLADVTTRLGFQYNMSSGMAWNISYSIQLSSNNNFLARIIIIIRRHVADLRYLSLPKSMVFGANFTLVCSFYIGKFKSIAKQNCYKSNLWHYSYLALSRFWNTVKIWKRITNKATVTNSITIKHVL